MEDVRPLVIDLGSGWIKAGFAGDAAPQVVFPAVVGRPRHTGIRVGMEQNDAYVSDEALAKRGVLSCNNPIEGGIVTNWDDLEKILHHLFYRELGVAPQEQTVLVALAPLTPKADLERLTQILFETFTVPAMAIATQAVLALFAAARTTGIVLDSGDGVTHATPIVQGQVLPDGTHRLDVAGNALTDYLGKSLAEKGIALTTTAEHAALRDMKEKLCYVALDFAAETATADANPASAAYELPNGDTVTLAAERVRCPEVLFQPALIGREGVGIHRLLYQSIMHCAAEQREALFANIVLAGGTTLLPGLPARLEKELTALAPPGTNVAIVAPPARHHAAWMGGAMIASDPAWQDDLWVSAEEYNESGPDMIHRKAF